MYSSLSDIGRSIGSAVVTFNLSLSYHLLVEHLVTAVGFSSRLKDFLFRLVISVLLTEGLLC